MAENLVSGNSINFVFDADDYISITGNATVIATGPNTSVNTSTTGTATFGPYAGGASVRIIATGNLTYTVTRPRGADTPMYFDQERGTIPPDEAGALGALLVGTKIPVVLLGDSLTNENFTSVTANSVEDFSLGARWFGLANALSQSKFVVANNAGMSGDFLDAQGGMPGMLARLNSPDTGRGTPGAMQTTNGGPGVFPFGGLGVVFLGGMNNIYNSTQPVADVISAWRVVASALRQKYSRTVVCTIPAVNNATPNFSTRASVHAALNAAIRDYAASTAGVVLADLFRVTVNPLDASFVQGSASIYRDGQLHPNNLGGYLIAKEIARALQVAFPGVGPDILPRSNLETISTASYASALPVNLLDDPLLPGSSAISTGVFTGNIPAGLSGATFTAGAGISAVACSVVARADGYGNDLVMDIDASSGTSANVQVSWPNQASKAVAGGLYKFGCEITIQGKNGTGNPANMFQANMRLQATYNSQTRLMDCLAWSATDAAYPESMTLVLESANPFVYPAGQTVNPFRPFVLASFNAAGSGRMKVGRVFLRRVG